MTLKSIITKAPHYGAAQGLNLLGAKAINPLKNI
jgi:hypothetical protein